MTWQLQNIFVGKLQNVSLCCDYCSSTLKRRHDYWLSRRKIAKLAPKNPSRGGEINCESGNSGELCGRVCAIIKQRAPAINECLMSARDVGDVLFIIGICVLYLSLSLFSLFAYSIIIGALLSGARRDKHRDIIEYWLYFDEGETDSGKCQSKIFSHPLQKKYIEITK